MISRGSRDTFRLTGLAAAILALSLAGCAGGNLAARDSQLKQGGEILASLETKSASGEREEGDPAGFPVKIVFATPEGVYVDNVKVSFQKDGETREIFSEGPWLYVKGGPGRYHVQAQGPDGKAAGASFSISEGGERKDAAPQVVILSLAEGGAGRGGPSGEASPDQPGQTGQNPPPQSQPEENRPGQNQSQQNQPEQSQPGK